LARQEELLRYLRIAGASGDQAHDSQLALRQPAATRAAAPGADAERPQPLSRHFGNGVCALLARGVYHLAEHVLGLTTIARYERRAEIETRPQRIEAEAELAGLARHILEQLARRGVAEE